MPHHSVHKKHIASWKVFAAFVICLISSIYILFSFTSTGTTPDTSTWALVLQNSIPIVILLVMSFWFDTRKSTLFHFIGMIGCAIIAFILGGVSFFNSLFISSVVSETANLQHILLFFAFFYLFFGLFLLLLPTLLAKIK